MTFAPPLQSLIPDNAPFTPEQRSWLNGLFAGLLSIDNGVTALSAAEAAALVPQDFDAPALSSSPNDDEETPWHDQTIPLADRMKLAEGKPLALRMMAAMAQQDCGQCGYNCRDYSLALFEGREERLNLCVPGGKDTARLLKTLHAELTPIAAPAVLAAPAVPASDPASADRAQAPSLEPGRHRDRPTEVRFADRKRLNKEGSEKETWHVDIDLAGTSLDYSVGDSFGIFPRNPPMLVEAVIRAIDAPPDFPIAEGTLHDVLTDGVSLGAAPDMLFQLISYVVGGERREKAKELAGGGDPDGDAESLDVLAAVEKFPGFRPDPEAFIEALDPLQPRLYSIASSPRIDAHRVSLAVDAVRYRVGERMRLGCASTYFADRLAPGAKVKGYVQNAHAFGLPADPATPIIMIGPGTGVAPFRAFLQERMATKARGRNWLFFGHQRRAHDFFYEDEFSGLQAAGVLSRLSLAWSRDGGRKVYVQDRMREAGSDLWAWLAEGAHVYLCGDAKRMAPDVERALIEIVADHGGRAAGDAAAFVDGLKRRGRYQTDVY
jgi:sulfite reductase (NADPH) flavoprotein alpha-component